MEKPYVIVNDEKRQLKYTTDSNGVPSTTRLLSVFFGIVAFIIAIVACFSPLWGGSPDSYLGIISMFCVSAGSIKVGGAVAEKQPKQQK